MQEKTKTALAALAVAVAKRRADDAEARARAAESRSVNVDIAAALESIGPVVRSVVDQMRAELRGEDGRSVTDAEVLALIRGVFDERKQELRGEDGRSVTADEVLAVVTAVFDERASELRGEDGRSVTDDEVLAHVRAVFDERAGELRGQPGLDASAEAVADILRPAIAADVRAEFDARSADLRGKDGSPGLVWRGEWSDRARYAPGDVVRHNAAAWVALSESYGVHPGSDERFWDVVVVDGSSGRVSRSGAGGQRLIAGDGIDITDGVISAKLRWSDYKDSWTNEPEIVGVATAPVAGDVWSYTLGGVTRYRLVPDDYSPAEDAFYSAFVAGACTGLIVSRSQQ